MTGTPEAEDPEVRARFESLRLQLISLAANADDHQIHLFECDVQEAGAYAKAFLPNIKASLQDILQRLSLSGNARSSQPGLSHCGTT